MKVSKRKNKSIFALQYNNIQHYVTVLFNYPLSFHNTINLPEKFLKKYSSNNFQHIYQSKNLPK